MSVTVAAPYGDNEALQTPWRVRLETITFDNSYPAGGYAVAPGDVGLSIIIGAYVIGVPAGLGFAFEWDTTNGKLVVLQSEGVSGELQQPPAGTDLSGVSVVFAFLGI